MKFRIIIFVLFFKLNFCFSQKTELKSYTNYLESQNFKTSKDYIIEKFKTKDIVIISERDHRDLTQYELIFEILKDKNFKGNIYTEVGCSNNYKKINDFLINNTLIESKKNEELLKIYRDLDYSLIWDKYSFYALLSTIYEINKKRNDKEKILLFPLDIEFEWRNIECNSQYKMFDDLLEKSFIDRNLIMGENFIKFYEFAKSYNPERTKALVIQNTYHGYIRIPTFLPLPTKPNLFSTSEYIYKTYPNRTTNIYINYFTQNFHNGLTNNGLFDAAFAFTKIDNVGFDLKDTPFGNSKFDLYNFGGSDYENVNFDYIFDGMIFYKPIVEMNLATGIPNIYPKEFEKQFYYRGSLIENITYDNSVKKNMNYLKEVNLLKESKLDKIIITKINKQIKYWLEE